MLLKPLKSILKTLVRALAVQSAVMGLPVNPFNNATALAGDNDQPKYPSCSHRDILAKLTTCYEDQVFCLNVRVGKPPIPCDHSDSFYGAEVNEDYTLITTVTGSSTSDLDNVHMRHCQKEETKPLTSRGNQAGITKEKCWTITAGDYFVGGIDGSGNGDEMKHEQGPKLSLSM